MEYRYISLHKDKGKFSRYNLQAILPFIKEAKITILNLSNASIMQLPTIKKDYQKLFLISVFPRFRGSNFVEMV